ncbi:unnamed protein product [Ixodes pacificus]
MRSWSFCNRTVYRSLKMTATFALTFLASISATNFQDCDIRHLPAPLKQFVATLGPLSMRGV